MFDFLKRLAGAKPEQPAAHNTRLVRSFSAAQVSRVLAPWKWDGGFSNTEIAAALSTIRQRSRDMEKNSEHYLRWLDLFVANVVGDGFKFKPLPGRETNVEKVDVVRSGKVRRAKLFYLRKLTGKKSKLKEIQS